MSAGDLWSAAYVAVMVGLWMSFARSLLEALDSDAPVDNGDRAAAMIFGAVLTVVWPVSLLARFMYRRFKGSEQLVTQRERLERAEERARLAEVEMCRVKAAAKAMNLPWPEER